MIDHLPSLGGTCVEGGDGESKGGGSRITVQREFTLAPRASGSQNEFPYPLKKIYKTIKTSKTSESLENQFLEVFPFEN